jgi:hypothetical protein
METITIDQDHVIFSNLTCSPRKETAAEQKELLRDMIAFFEESENFAFLKGVQKPAGFYIVNQPREEKVARWFGRPPKIVKREHWVLAIRFENPLTEQDTNFWRMFTLGYHYAARNHRRWYF